MPKSEPGDRPANLIPGEEIAELFRKTIRREVKIAAVGKSWKDVYAGEVRFRIAGYELVIFNDCNELDYVDSAVAPDGRRGDFDGWWESHTEPVSLLNDHERRRMEDFLERAPVDSPSTDS